jgi:ActR/RegA family two-component response regulator
MYSHLRLRNPLALVIDDDRILLEVVKRLLARAGLDVTAVPSAAQARARTERFQVGVFDIELGGECGVDLAAEMVGSGQVQAAVFFTGGASDAKLARATRLGPVVSKGEHPKRLVEVVLELIHSDRPWSTGQAG